MIWQLHQKSNSLLGHRNKIFSSGNCVDKRGHKRFRNLLTGAPYTEDMGQSSLMKSCLSLKDSPIQKLHLEVRSLGTCFLTLHKDTGWHWLTCRQAISFLKRFSGGKKKKKKGYDAGKKHPAVLWPPYYPHGPNSSSSRMMLASSASSIPPKPNPIRPGLPEEHGGLHPHHRLPLPQANFPPCRPSNPSHSGRWAGSEYGVAFWGGKW